MSFLTLGGNVIPCSLAAGARIDIEETGGRERMFDASMVEAVRARKRVIPLMTPAVSRAQAETYVSYLLATPPIAGNGDLFNSVSTSCFVKYQGMTAVGVPGSVKWQVSFTLYEA